MVTGHITFTSVDFECRKSVNIVACQMLRSLLEVAYVSYTFMVAD
jgi:hypothetical protein